MLSFDGIVSLTNEEWLWQAPFFIAVSVGAGSMGALFNLSRKWLWRVRAAPARHSLRLMEAVAVGVFSIGTIFLVSAKAGTCVQVSTRLELLGCWAASLVARHMPTDDIPDYLTPSCPSISHAVLVLSSVLTCLSLPSGAEQSHTAISYAAPDRCRSPGLYVPVSFS